ncbi:hypothetical protein C345_04701 [Cryptococcus neoformans A2-102-5]|nr:hypothetical protein C346_04809 [Cryptococcus neoformans var. grubii D17-1]OXG93524.1 hypothetical protein C345_04701 [Cryptococcus neoformans var. grubii A2-102-5]
MDRTSPRKGPRRGDGENRGSFLKSEPAARVLQVLNLGQATLNKNNRYGTPTMAQRSKAIVFLIATAMYASSIFFNALLPSMLPIHPGYFGIRDRKLPYLLLDQV